jgi:hypothetical protein
VKHLALAAVVMAAALAGCGTSTVTVHRPPNLGPPSGAESHTVGTLRGYRPKHGNAEQANYYSASGCGVERWAVKTLTDPAANQVSLAIQGSSIADLVTIAPPTEPTDRVGPTETTVFQVSGTLTFAKQEADSDYHLVLDDGHGNTMIVESPAPHCASGSVVLAQIEQVRQQLDTQLPALARGEVIRPNMAATVTGVGFFDRLHGQTGVAPNGIELHPLLSVQLQPLVAARGRLTPLHEERAAD